MNMRKLILFLMVVVMALTLMGGLALAGGWSTVSTTSHNPDNGVWGTSDVTTPVAGGSPHGGFSNTSNKCRVCHAVHGAESPRGSYSFGTSWRLLAAADRSTECDYCHGATGATQLRPFGPKSYTVYGQHTITSTSIPDAEGQVTINSPGLSCGNCHSVHGAGVVSGTYAAKLLRSNPNGDTSDLATGVPGAVSGPSNDTEKLANFCADCHNKNPNWDTDSADDLSSASSPRPNSRSHVQGPAAQGSLEVYGATTTVAGWAGVSQNTTTGCIGCHSATSAGNDYGALTTQTVSAFPHETKGAKLLQDSITRGTAQVGTSNTNDANRVIPQMDEVCLGCHQSGGEGVGLTF